MRGIDEQKKDARDACRSRLYLSDLEGRLECILAQYERRGSQLERYRELRVDFMTITDDVPRTTDCREPLTGARRNEQSGSRGAEGYGGGRT